MTEHEQTLRALPIPDETFDRLREQGAEIDRQVRGFVREYPVVATAGALFVGFALARMIARR